MRSRILEIWKTTILHCILFTSTPSATPKPGPASGGDLEADDDGLEGAEFIPTIHDPISANGTWDATERANFCQEYRQKLLQAAEQGGVDLRPDYSNICSSAAVLDVLYDVRAISRDLLKAEQIHAFLVPTLDHLLSQEVITSDLEACYKRHEQYPMAQMHMRLLAEVFEFIGNIFIGPRFGKRTESAISNGLVTCLG